MYTKPKRRPCLLIHDVIHPPSILPFHQYPGGLILCDTLVHLGSSISSLALFLSFDHQRYVLRMLFLYFFSFLSKMVYLSFGTISCSIGISAFHLSTALVVMPCFAKALSTTATTVSTARRRFRCRAFWNFDSRHGIFLHLN